MKKSLTFIFALILTMAFTFTVSAHDDDVVECGDVCGHNDCHCHMAPDDCNCCSCSRHCPCKGDDCDHCTFVRERIDGENVVTSPCSCGDSHGGDHGHGHAHDHDHDDDCDCACDDHCDGHCCDDCDDDYCCDGDHGHGNDHGHAHVHDDDDSNTKTGAVSSAVLLIPAVIASASAFASRKRKD